MSSHPIHSPSYIPPFSLILHILNPFTFPGDETIPVECRNDCGVCEFECVRVLYDSLIRRWEGGSLLCNLLAPTILPHLCEPPFSCSFTHSFALPSTFFTFAPSTLPPRPLLIWLSDSSIAHGASLYIPLLSVCQSARNIFSKSARYKSRWDMMKVWKHWYKCRWTMLHHFLKPLTPRIWMVPEVEPYWVPAHMTGCPIAKSTAVSKDISSCSCGIR